MMTLLLPWFPIVLAVGVGGRLLGRARGMVVGVICALFWIVLVQAQTAVAVWSEPAGAVAMLAGAVAIAAVGRWSGEMAEGAPSFSLEKGGGWPKTLPGVRPPPLGEAKNGAPAFVTSGGDADAGDAQQQLIATAVDRFDDWLLTHRDDRDPWQQFDEFLRTLLYECCQATHVRPFRCLGDGEQLVRLTSGGPEAPLAGEAEPRRVSGSHGIVGLVLSSGRAFVRSDSSDGATSVPATSLPVRGTPTDGTEAGTPEAPASGPAATEPARAVRLADPSEGSRVSVGADPNPPGDRSIAWCFCVRQGVKRLGVVVVGQLGLSPPRQQPLLHVLERLVNQFWCMLAETMLSRSAVQVDPVSGLPTRAAFLRAAEDSLHASYAEGEPVAVAVFALEGLRDMNDSGRWEIADDLVREVGSALTRKVRMEDRLGRFDGSRIILLLRRVDDQLASWIVSQMVSRVTAVCEDSAFRGTGVVVRCGVAGSGDPSACEPAQAGGGSGPPTLRTLVSRALLQCQRARLEDAAVVSDRGLASPVAPAPA